MALHSQWVNGTLQFYDGSQSVVIIPTSTGTFAFGSSGDGMDVRFYGDTVAKYMLWDESLDKLVVVGAADITGNFVADAYYAGTTGAAGTGVSSSGARLMTAGTASITIVKGIVTAYTT